MCLWSAVWVPQHTRYLEAPPNPEYLGALRSTAAKAGSRTRAPWLQKGINIEALCAAPPEALAPKTANATELPSCAPISARAAQRRRRWRRRRRRWWCGRGSNLPSSRTGGRTSPSGQHATAHADPQGQGKLRPDARGRLRGKGVDELRDALRFRATRYHRGNDATFPALALTMGKIKTFTINTFTPPFFAAPNTSSATSSAPPQKKKQTCRKYRNNPVIQRIDQLPYSWRHTRRHRGR